MFRTSMQLRSTSLRPTIAIALFSVTAYILAGCGAIGGISRDTSETTIVPDAVFEIEADQNLNPDVRGIAKPVQLRIYQLRSKSNFEGAGFLDLQEKDDVILSSDFVGRNELTVLPGERRTFVIKGNPAVSVFGVLAAFRSLEKGPWRTIASAPNSLELQKNWWGFGSIEKPGALHYKLKLSPTQVQLELKP